MIALGHFHIFVVVHPDIVLLGRIDIADSQLALAHFDSFVLVLVGSFVEEPEMGD